MNFHLGINLDYRNNFNLIENFLFEINLVITHLLSSIESFTAMLSYVNTQINIPFLTTITYSLILS